MFKCFQHCHNVQTERQSGPSVLTLLPGPKVHNSRLKVKQTAEYRIFIKWLQLYLLALCTKQRKLKE